MSVFKTLTNNKDFHSWFYHTSAFLHAQGMQVVLNPAYRPRTRFDHEELQKKTRWFFALLLDKVQTPTGKALVSDYCASTDSRQLVVALRSDATTSTAGLLSQRSLRTTIMSLRCVPAKWTGRLVEFLLLFRNYVKVYNENCFNGHQTITDATAKEWLEMAVDPFPCLAAVKTQEVMDSVRVRDPLPATYDRYFLPDLIVLCQ